ncbi:hypothetical protein LTR08_008146 [Meristemomyces frigidus]|nr:hypothetical protein LTR08_008146 [Meristemomyces frigidus]
MAYDQGSAYQAPRRAYNGQQGPQQAPAQQPYRDARQEQYDGYAQQEGSNQLYNQDQRAYGQGYEQPQQSGRRTGYGQDVGQAQSRGQGYSDGYEGGYQRAPTRGPPNGDRQPQQQQQERNYDPRFQQNGDRQPQQQQQERNYDPRYQQRGPRAVPQGSGQHPGQAPQQPPQHIAQQQQRPPERQPQMQDQRQPTRQDYQQPRQPEYQEQPRNQQRPDPRNGYPQLSNGHRQQQQPLPAQAQPPPQNKRQTFDQQSADLISPPRIQGDGTVPKPPPPPQNQAPKKMTMEEWKAQAKAKLHADSQSPEYMPQDNAFPVFPNKKNESRLRPEESRAGTAMSQRSSGEQRRTSASSGQRAVGDVANQARPSMDRKASGQEASQERQGESRPLQPQQGRPSYGRQGSSQRQMLPTVSGPVSERYQDPEGRPSLDHQVAAYGANQDGQVDARPPPQRQQSQGTPSYDGQQQQGQWPTQNQPPRDDLRSPPPPQVNGHRQAPLQNQPPREDLRSPPPRVNESRQTPVQSQPLREDLRSPPPPQQTNGRQQPPMQSQESYQNDGYAPQRPQIPSQPQHARPGTAGGRPQIQPIDTRQMTQQPGAAYMDHQPFSPVQVPLRPSTAHDTTRSPSGRQVTSPPSQLSYSHNPHSHEEGQRAVLQPWTQLVPSTHESLGDFYDNYGEVDAVAPATRDDEIEMEMPDFDSAAPQQTSLLHKMKQTVDRQATPTQEPTQQYRREQDFHQQPPQQQNMGYQQRAPPVQLPQPSYANEMPPRRSMDDARQMPYRQGPPQPQRFQPNGQPVRGPLPPQQQRTDVNRNLSGQTVQSVWSESGQQRVGSAPPVRQGLQEPPGRPPVGVPLTQQRSAPEHSNPDALPRHPVPVRPGLMEVDRSQSAKPPPIRNYDNASISSGSSRARRSSLAAASLPVTHAELEQLRKAVDANPQNYKQALVLAKKLVEASTVLASDGGRADPRTTAKNREKYVLEAYKRVKKLASSGFPEAQFYLADAHGQGSLGLEVDTKEAFSLYQAAAKQGHAQAAYRTAVCCEMGPEEGGGTRKDYAKALQWYRRAAALGDAAAMYKLGIVLLKGLLGQKRDVGESVTWLKRAAEKSGQGDPHALFELAGLYDSANRDGEVRAKVLADDGYARELFQQAAAVGYKVAQFRLGQAYEYGALGLTIDNRASIAWYSKAAAQGEHQAELALSGWYLTGAEGILEHSDTEAYLWARKAASSEPPLAKAMFAMGYFSEQGIGCPASVEEARKWYGRAASYRFPKALERIEELKRTGKARPAPSNGKLTRNQKKDEAECVVQ